MWKLQRAPLEAVLSHARCFSTVPLFKSGQIVNWFPGHMAKATKDLEERVRGVDMVIEVRDSRVCRLRYLFSTESRSLPFCL